jgi:phage shock protein A
MDKYENPQHKIIKSDYEDLEPDYKKITNSLERLRGYIKSLKEICDEINAKINEAE